MCGNIIESGLAVFAFDREKDWLAMKTVACVFCLLQISFLGTAVASRRREIKKLSMGYQEMEDVSDMAASYSQYFVPAGKVHFDYSSSKEEEEEKDVGLKSEEEKEDKKGDERTN